MAAAASTPRRSTPARRARSSSVASNTSSRAPSSARKSTAAAAKKEATATPSKKESTSTPKKESTTSTPRASSAKKNSAASARPALPEKKNPKLPGEPVQVKLQTIKREEQSIIIGRVKLETVNGADHGFLLKRFDTNAVAASSMFRLAFPYADGEAERLEMAYLDRKFDTDRANGGMVSKPKRGRPKKGAADDDKSAKTLPEGSTGVRLQGTWLPCEDALDIAEEYGLALYAKPLINAQAASVNGVATLVTSDGTPTTPAKALKAETSDGTPASNRKRQRTSKAAEATPSKDAAATAASPKTSSARSRSKKTSKGDTDEITHTKTTTSIEAAAGLTQAQIDEQIKKSRELAQQVQSSSSGKSTAASRKRRASNDRPTADLDPLADDDSATTNFVSRPLRRAGRVVRRRPVATAAGTMGAVAAAGVGALAWFAGGNLDVAQQILQQGFTQLQGFFF